tara:strand:- start:4424 stop:4816 length:393 start_codon:yes stop_codon:yes gene_type:complete
VGSRTAQYDAVRFDATRSLYDLRDAFQAAYGNDRAWRDSTKQYGKNFGLGDDQFQRVKWSDQANTGPGRVVVNSKTCAIILRQSIRLHERAALGPQAVALWFETQAGCATQPRVLPALHSAHAVTNTHIP